MTLKFDGQGVQTNTFDEIFTNLDDGYREIYGQDIITEQESPDGQRIGIESVSRLDVEALGGWLYSQLDSDLNTGDMQQVIGKIAGVSLLPAGRSQWDLIINTSRDITIPSGYTVADQNDTEWFLDSDVVANTGDNTITFLAVEWGDVSGVASGSSFTQSTPELYIDSISATTDAVKGREEETEEEFRLRRKSSVENPSQSTTGAIYAKMAQLNGVIDLAVYDNGTNDDDMLTGSSNRDLVNSGEVISLDAHTLWVVVEGGSLDDIGETMIKQSLGASKGDTDVSYSDTLTRPDGTEITIINEAKVDRPDYIDLHVRLNVKLTKTGESIDIESIKDSLESRSFYIGHYIQAGELYESVYIDNYNYVPSDLEISLDGTTWTDELLFSGFKGKFVIDTDNVTVTEV